MSRRQRVRLWRAQRTAARLRRRRLFYAVCGADAQVVDKPDGPWVDVYHEPDCPNIGDE